MRYRDLDTCPLVSIIIPVYNVEEYMDECIESVLNQTYKNIEIIIVDDGSTDKSGEKCNLYNDDRVIVIHQDNKGLAEARNVGIEASKGEYISFVDSDDYISETMIENMIGSILKTGSLIACCDYTRKQEEIYYGCVDEEMVLDSISAISNLFNDRGYRVFAWSKMFHKSIFDSVRFPKGELYEDIKPMYVAFKSVSKVSYVNKPLYFYRKRQGAITDTFNVRSYDRVRAINSVMRDCKNKKELFNELLPKYASNYLYYLNGSYRAGVVITAIDKKLQVLVKKNWKRIIKSDGLELTTKISLLTFGISPAIYRCVYIIYYRMKKAILEVAKSI